ncbi:MAG: serpin family protein [Bryobacteraceae bacterium]
MTHHLSVAIPFLLAGALFASSDVTPGMNRFAASAYRQLSEKNGNLIFSPFSISTALSMLLAGARGPTAAGISAALDQSGTGSEYHAAVASLAAELIRQANLGGNQLAIANGLWVQQGFPLQAEFEQTLGKVYQAPLTAATRLVLTSAIYFYGKWRSPFDVKNTRAEPFQLGGGGTVDAQFMHQKADFLYSETPAAQILEMRYQGTPLAFDILLPKTNDGLAELEGALKPEALSASFGALRSAKVETAIPKFRAESSFSLKQMLSRMGMADSFSVAADFSGIDGRRDLLVGDAVHKAFVEVSEEGTEAAAATGITVRPLAMRRQEQIVFRADHPFAFFIRDTTSGAILFEGRLVQPKS